MPEKNATFCISWKEKIPKEFFFKKYQQNTNHNKIDL
jgi:hypothetical protein